MSNQEKAQCLSDHWSVVKAFRILRVADGYTLGGDK